MKWVFLKPSTIFLATVLSRKMLQSSDPMYSYILLENMQFYNFDGNGSHSGEATNFTCILF